MNDRIDVFVSYKREERAFADAVKEALVAKGYVAVSDVNLRNGDDFGDAIDHMLRQAKLVLVLWTEAAIKSDWVRKEARLADKLKKYQGVWLVADCQPHELLPVDFSSLHLLDASMAVEPVSVIVESVTERIGVAANTEIVARAASKSLNDDLTVYQAVETLGIVEAYEAYLRNYPNGPFTDAAKQKIRDLTSWRTNIRPYLPSVAGLSVVIGVAGLLIGYMQVPPEARSIGVFQGNQLQNMDQPEGKIASREANPQLQSEVEAALKSATKERDEAVISVRNMAIEIEALKSKIERLEYLNDTLRSDWEASIVDRNKAILDKSETDTKLKTVSEERDAAQILTQNLRTRVNTLEKSLKENSSPPHANSDIGELSNTVLTSSAGTGTECLGQSGEMGVQIAGNCHEADSQAITISDPATDEAGSLDHVELSKLKQLPNLSQLVVSSDTIKDISPLMELKSLTLLKLHLNHEANLEPLSSLERLLALDLESTPVSDIVPLSSIKTLRTLNLKGTNATNLRPLKALSELILLELPNGKKILGKTDVQAFLRTL